MPSEGCVVIFHLGQLLQNDIVLFEGGDFKLEAVIAAPGEAPTVSQMYNDDGNYIDAVWRGFVDIGLDSGLQKAFYGTGEERMLYTMIFQPENLSLAHSPNITSLLVTREFQPVIRWQLP